MDSKPIALLNSSSNHPNRKRACVAYHKYPLFRAYIVKIITIYFTNNDGRIDRHLVSLSQSRMGL
jgi:hypothetical protein